MVTLKVTLKRFSLLDVDRRKEEINNSLKGIQEKQMLLEKEDEVDADEQPQQNKRKVWEKQPKKKAKKGGKAAPKVKI